MWRLPELVTVSTLAWLIQSVGGEVQCTTESLTRCTGPLKVITDSQDLTFATSKDQLKRMCPKLMDGLHCIDSYTQLCLSKEQKKYFNSLYTGTTLVIEDLCREGSYQRLYLRHAPCMRRVQEEYRGCSARYQEQLRKLEHHTYDKVEGSGVGQLCCSFQSYLSCSQGVVNRTCGPDTATFTKEFLDRMATPLAQGHCQDYTVGSQKCDFLGMSRSSRTFSPSTSPQTGSLPTTVILLAALLTARL